MIKINLLSPLDKENLRWEKINNMAVKSIIWVVLAQMVFVGVFLFSVEYLKAERSAVSEQLASLSILPATQEVKTIESDLKINKSNIQNIYTIQSGRVGWTMLLENISKTIPAGIRLESISAQGDASGSDTKAAAKVAGDETSKTTNAGKQVASKPEDEKIKVDISGNAKTRELLLALEANLKGSDMFFDLQYDTSNYVESKDIDFRYTFYVLEQKLLK